MKVRAIAGLGMSLLAAGLLTVFFLGENRDPGPATDQRGPVPGVPRAREAGAPGPAEVDSFLAGYNARYRRLWTDCQGADWDAGVDATPEHGAAQVAAAGRLADFVGGRSTIEQLRLFRGRLDLTDLQDRQIEVAWQLAAHAPATAAQAVPRLLATAAALTDSLAAHEHLLSLPGQPPRRVTPREIDQLLAESSDLVLRQAAWESSQSAGPILKDGLVEARDLRNAMAREMGYSSFFHLETADYGLTADQMIRLMDELTAGIMPLYQQLHCWARHELARRYGVDQVPARLPAHWLGRPDGQQWPGLVADIDLDGMFTDVRPRWVMEQAERFYTSLGLEPLPETFWERSDLYELPADSPRKKDTHASAWHIDLDRDVRSLMSVKADFRWFSTTHRELGHIYYFLACSRDEVPPILRRGANRAFHEAVGSLMELAAGQPPYLQQMGLLGAEEAPDSIAWLLNQALQGPVVSLPFTCGTMTHWEHDLYEQNLPRHQFNTRWWEYAARYQGVVPPGERGEDFCDPATRALLSDDPARHYDGALGALIRHQLHRYICREILHQDVHAANYYGNLQVGRYLQSILRLGATRDWSLVMRQATGEDLGSEALLEYFAPLQKWLEKQNEGRVVGF